MVTSSGVRHRGGAGGTSVAAAAPVAAKKPPVDWSQRRRSIQGMIMLAVAFAALYLIIEKKLNPRDAAPDGGAGDRAAVYEEADEQLRAERNLAPLCCEAVLEDVALKEVSQRCMDSHQPRDAEVVLLTYLPRASLDTYGKYALSIMGGYALTHGHRLERYTGLVPKDKRHPEYHRVLIMWKWMKSAMKQPEVTRPKFVLWMDSDAVPVDFEGGAVAKLMRKLKHGEQLMLAGEPREDDRSGSMQLLCNTGVVALRVSQWNVQFLEAWWKAGGTHEGRPDHAVLDWMYREDQLGVQAKLRLVSMEAMNGGLGTYKLPVEQPIMHLVAMSDDLRLQVLGTLNRALCTAVLAQNGTRVEVGRGRPLPSNWPAIVRNTAMDAHLSVLKALVATNANSPKGFRLMFQLAEALVNNNELCTPDGAKPRKCLDHWGGWEDALGLFEAIEVAMRVTEAAPNEKVSLLQKIAAVSVPLNKTEDALRRLQEAVVILEDAPEALKTPQLELWQVEILDRMSALLRQAGKPEPALETLTQAMELWVKHHGVDNEKFVEYQTELTFLVTTMGQVKSQTARAQAALQLQRDQMIAQHLHTVAEEQYLSE